MFMEPLRRLDGQQNNHKVFPLLITIRYDMLSNKLAFSNENKSMS